MSGYRISFKRWSNPRRADLDGYNAWDYVDASPDEVFETRKEAQARLRDTKRGKDSEGVNAIFRVVKARSNPGMAKLKFGSPAWRKKYMKANKPKKTATYRYYVVNTRPGQEYEQGFGSRSEAIAWKRNQVGRMWKIVKRRSNGVKSNSAIRGNPPSSWTNVKQFRVVKKNGRAVLEVRK
jgi:hypothetical protein